MSKGPLSVLCLIFLATDSHQAVVSTTPAPVKRWQCSSNLSTYTDTDCNQKGEIPGCYYEQNLKLYQSCGVVCNDIEFGSREDEGRCKLKCPYYLSRDGGCILVTDGVTTAPTDTGSSSDQTQKKDKPWIAGIVVPVIVIILVVSTVVILRKKKPEWLPACCRPAKKENDENLDPPGNGIPLRGDAEVDHPAQYPIKVVNNNDNPDPVDDGRANNPGNLDPAGNGDNNANQELLNRGEDIVQGVPPNQNGGERVNPGDDAQPPAERVSNSSHRQLPDDETEQTEALLGPRPVSAKKLR